MSTTGLTPGATFLIDAARAFFKEHYENPSMYLDEKLHKNLEWTPALRFVIQQHINIFVEPSETGPYPRIFMLKQANIQNFPEPIAIYAVCPEDMLTSSSQRTDMKRLQAHGFGLITVDQDGQANRLFSATPLVQIIPRSEFKDIIRRLPLKIRQRTSEAFDDYMKQPASGVKTLSEIIEGLVEQAGKDAVKKGYVSMNNLGNGTASILDALYDINQYNNIRAEFGGVRGYFKAYRNISHHWPRSKQKAYQKFADCRHAFLDGIKQIRRFQEATKSVGLSGNLPRL